LTPFETPFSTLSSGAITPTIGGAILPAGDICGKSISPIIPCARTYTASTAGTEEHRWATAYGITTQALGHLAAEDWLHGAITPGSSTF